MIYDNATAQNNKAPQNNAPTSGNTMIQNSDISQNSAPTSGNAMTQSNVAEQSDVTVWNDAAIQIKGKRIVVKVGTSTLTHATGRLNIRRVENLVKTIADLQNAGNQMIMVSSGAIGLGMSRLGLSERPKETAVKQACAAVGQCELMDMYDKQFSSYGVTVAQLLLTKYVLLEDRRRNVENAMAKLIGFGVIPIVNENDTVAIDELELEVGENDSLAAIVASVAKADLLVILSDIDGMYDKDPHRYDDARLIAEVHGITDDIRALAGGAGSGLGTGGMATKLNAASIANENGIDMIIMNGSTPELLYDICEGKAVGTRFFVG